MFFLKDKKSKSRGSADIRGRWFSIHFHIQVLFVLASLVIENIILFVLPALGSSALPVSPGVQKHPVLTVGIYLACLAADIALSALRGISETGRIYLVSILFLISCTMLYASYPFFGVLMFVFPALLTLIYGSYLLTILISGLSAVFYLTLNLVFTDFSNDVSASGTAAAASYFICSVILLFCLYALMLAIVHLSQLKNRTISERNRERSQLMHSLKTDNLTGLYNRAALNEALDRLCRASHVENCFLAFMDIDHFKRINDTYGHPIGDMCLQLAAGVLRNAGSNSRAYRYGGDEFCIIFYNVSSEEVMDACHRIQHLLDRSDFIIPSLQPTFSIGLAAYQDDMSAEDLLAAADQALYHAKKRRNCIRTAS